MCIVTASALAESRSEILPFAKSLGKQLGDAPALVTFFASSNYDLGEVNETLRNLYPDAMVLGTTTAGEFTERADAKNAVAMFAIAGDFEVRGSMAFHLSQDVERAVVSATSSLPRAMDGYSHKTALLFLDPLSCQGDKATLLASEYFGEDVTLAGGGASGVGSMQGTLCLNRLVASDALALLVLYTKTPVGVGLSHGHRAVSEPMRVTRAHGQLVYELDGKPAWDTWVNATGACHMHELENLNEDALSRFLLTYEAGLRDGDHLSLRVPVSRGSAGELGFAGRIPEGSEIWITQTSLEAQVESAHLAARQARQALNGARVSGALVFDSLCRNIILGNRFDEAVRGIGDELGPVPFAGFETHGEIGGFGGRDARFHNTSTVVLAFGS
ncbi:MAG: FIST N-terminal domain-containing protein [Myxococcota bacterium]